MVIDVETNGTRTASDDLLSLSIFDPSTGLCYNRMFPLELQPTVLTGWINGIKDSDLETCLPLTQNEVNDIISFFDINNKIILSFSGGKGTFDISFIKNYFKRHRLIGFDEIETENIKDYFPVGEFDLSGVMTKDNLCDLLGIGGVTSVHSSVNDCILEWGLFEKVKNDELFFVGNKLFRFHNGYVAPITYLCKSLCLQNYAGVVLPKINAKLKCIYSESFLTVNLAGLEKIGANVIGVSIENGIYGLLGAKRQDNSAFLVQNKKKLDYIGALPLNRAPIPVSIDGKGFLVTSDPSYLDFIKKVNDATSDFLIGFKPVAEFLKSNIFKGEMLSQEISISKDKKLFAICDLSDAKSILEIKTFNVLNENYLDNDITLQLYYESNGRNAFVLSIDFEKSIWASEQQKTLNAQSTFIQ